MEEAPGEAALGIVEAREFTYLKMKAADRMTKRLWISRRRSGRAARVFQSSTAKKKQ